MTSEYTTLRASLESIEALRRLTLDVAALAGRRVTYSQALAAVVAVAARDKPAVVAALPDDAA